MKNKHYIFLIFLFFSGNSFSQGGFKDVTTNNMFTPSTSEFFHGSGASAADFDNDGDIDFYYGTEKNESNQLYINQGGGQFIESGEKWGLNIFQRTKMSLWIDYNGDKKLDLLLSGDCFLEDNDCPEGPYLRLFRQDNGFFTEVTQEVGLGGYGATKSYQTFGGLAAGDLNLDGFIDFIHTVKDGPLEVFLNQNGESFILANEALGIVAPVDKYFQPYIGDLSNDGLLDVYVNLDFRPNILWVNSGGEFLNISESSNSNSSFNEMGIAVGDFDNDLDFDMYATNIINYLDKGGHNIFLINQKNQTGELKFTEQAKTYGIEDGGWGWGATFADFNNDGWLDLATTNGWETYDPIDSSKLWLNNEGSLNDVSKDYGFNDNLNGVSLLGFDYDNDGDIDLLQTLAGNESPEVSIRILENQLDTVSSTTHNFIKVKPRMTGNNHYAVGAVIKVFSDTKTFLRPIHAGISFYGQEPYEAHFGLGALDKIDSVQIKWPGGAVSTLYNPVINGTIEITDDDVIHAPTNLQAKAENNKIMLSWTDYSTNEDNFIIERSGNSNFSSPEVISVDKNITEYIDNADEANWDYHYRIKGVNSSMASGYSLVARVKYTNVITSVEKDHISEIRLFPNPVTLRDNYEVIIEGELEFYSVDVFDLYGRKIDFDIVKTAPETTKLRINGNTRHEIILIKINGESYIVRLLK